jgi:hypothetical protein
MISWKNTSFSRSIVLNKITLGWGIKHCISQDSACGLKYIYTDSDARREKYFFFWKIRHNIAIRGAVRKYAMDFCLKKFRLIFVQLHRAP